MVVTGAEEGAESSPRRFSSRRRTNRQNSSNNNNQSHAGSVGALRRIMKVDNKFSQNMRQSILIAAVLCRKRNEPYTQFLGSDGSSYSDVRSAFGKHGGINQCALCKQRVQGPFYCRIVHEHLDVPDYDGGNSFECLRALFRCSVDDLVERQHELLYQNEGSRKRKVIETAPSVLDGLDDNISSMDLMSEEVLLQIALFIPNLSCMISFCKTSKRMQKLLYTSFHSEKLFRGLFLQKFGKRGTVGNFEINLSWRERWRMIYGLRRGLLHHNSSDMLSLNGGTSANLLLPRRTIGVLSHAEESSALFYDNPWSSTDDISNGYFGMKILHLPPPPNAANDWQPPVVCHGDFNGVKIFNSVDAMFQNTRHRFISLGDDEGGGQVLALVQCDVSSWTNWQTNRSRPSFFIGFASGRVAAVNATIDECGRKYTFSISGFHDAHENEVTSLAFVNGVGNDGESGILLYSACGGGHVYCHPNALCPERNFSMDKAILAFSSNGAIFSLTSTTVDTGDYSSSIICTGDGEGKIRLWTRPDPALCNGSETHCFVPILVKQAGTRTGLVTRMKFVHNHNDLLVTCTNNGDVRIWKLHCCNKRSGGKKVGKPQLELKYDKMGLHNGAVEVVMNVGDMLLTSGGNDGRVVGVDLNNGLILQSIDCHTGERLQHSDGNTILAKSCVVDMIVSGKEGHMTTLCRDGLLQRWSFVVRTPI